MSDTLIVIQEEVSTVEISTPGVPGPAGVGVPAGGTTGQALVKASDTDFDSEWSSVAGGGPHAADHADGGSDEITDALDPRAYPLLADTLANRPAAAVAGRFFWTTDEGILYRDSGAAWVKVAVSDYPDLDDIPSEFPPEAHAHAGEDITSGTIADVRIAATIARDAEVTAAIAAHEAAGDPHPVYTTGGEVVAAILAALADADGEGLSDDGAGVLSVNVDGSTIEISADTLRLVAGGVTANEIAANAVGSSELADNAVDTGAIQDGAVTAAKVAADVATQAELDAHVNDTSAAHPASAVSADSTTLSGTGTDVQAVLEELDNMLDDHSARHENGGADEISVAGLSGELADSQPTDAAHVDSGAASDGHVLTADGAGGAAWEAAAGGGGGTDWQYETRSTNTILGVADKGKVIDITAAITQTFEADETLGDGWYVILRNATDDGTTVVTLNPAGTETIDGLTTVTMYSGEARLVMCNGAGANFNSVLKQGGYALFTADGNFVVPHGISQVTISAVGGGGGGGGGQGAAASTNRIGGSGGGGGARVYRTLPADLLGSPGDSVAVSVGVAAGGSAGSSAFGGNGDAGEATTFGTFIKAGGGGRGLGGGVSNNPHTGGGGGGELADGGSGVLNGNSIGGQQSAAGAQAGFGLAGSGGQTNAHVPGAQWGGCAGGNSGGGGTAGNSGGGSVLGGSGGGGGGSINSSNAAAAGGVAKAAGTFASGTAGGGAASGAAGDDGANGNAVISGGGGGGGGSNTAGTGGDGGDGGTPGGGGGGGGAGTTTGGAGGAGGRGECRVWYS